MDQPSPEARMNGQVGLKRGSERTTSSREIVLGPVLTRSSGACFLGLRCYWKPPITNSAATQPHSRDGERPSPTLVTGIDGAHVELEEKVWNTEMTRRISDIYAILKWLKHVQCITCNHRPQWFLYRKVIADIDRR